MLTMSPRYLYYNIVVDTGEIGVEQFAVRVQSLLVHISELAMAMIPTTGVRDSGRAIVVDIVSFITGTRAATTRWAQK